MRKNWHVVTNNSIVVENGRRVLFLERQVVWAYTLMF